MKKTGIAVPLTHAQMRIWYAEKKYRGLGLGNIVMTHRFPRPVDPEIAARAIRQCIRSNDGLRLRLNENEEGVHQTLSSSCSDMIDIYHFKDEFEKDLFLHEKSAEVFQLTDSDLYYFCVTHVQGVTGFYMHLHHTICDGWTVRLIADRIWETVQMLERGETDLREYPSYLAYQEKERQYINSPQCSRDRDYWLDLLKNMPPPVHFGTCSGPGPQIDSLRLNYYLTPEETAAMNAFCRNQDIQPSHFHFSVFIFCLSRLSFQKEMVLGTMVHNRTGRQEKATVGMFVNTVPFRVSVNGQLSFIEWIKDIARQVKGHMRHQKYPYDLLLQDLKNVYGYGTDWLRVVFSYDNFTHSIPVQWHPNKYEVVPLVLHVTERESRERLKFEFDFHSAAYEETDIARLFDCLKHCMSEIIRLPRIRLADLELIGRDEKMLLLSRFNDENTVPPFTSIPSLVEQMAGQYARHPAIVEGEFQLEYRELDARANQIAAVLQESDIGPGSLVGCLFPRSTGLIVSLLGILKTGAAYLPIDPAYPDSRIRHIIADSGLRHIMVHPDFRHMIDEDIHVVEYSAGLFRNRKRLCKPGIAPDDLLYVIYTSGSTGMPKGVMIEHTGFINLLRVHQVLFHNQPSDRMTQAASPGFDAMALEIWPCLTSGATLYIVPDQERKDPSHLQQWMIKNRITQSFQPTAVAESLIHFRWPEETALTHLKTGGERLTQVPSGELPFRFYNLYGPTEDTVFTTWCEIRSGSSKGKLPPIGRPIANHAVYIVDSEMNLQPVGATGELCISGCGLARGYVNNPELTRDKFCVNPFAPDAEAPYRRMYRTGDLAKWNPDGTLQYIGRLDNQVQIRGFRIEPGEIEYHLMQIAGVREAAVIARGSGVRENRLHAYVCGPASLTSGHIRSCLKAVLPEYMIPTSIHLMQSLPRNSHGKLDGSGLPVSVNSGKRTSGSRPVNEVQRCLVAAFEKHLGCKQVGIHDHYFEIGGDSIKAIQIAFELQKQGYDMHVTDLYEYPTIAEISGRIGRCHAAGGTTADSGPVPLTPIQHWFFERRFADQHEWNQSLIMRSGRRLNPEIVQLVLMNLIHCHPALRFTFREMNGSWLQQMNDAVIPYFDYLFEDLRHEDVYIDHLHGHINHLRQRMNLETGPLVKAAHFRTTDGDFIVLIIHHLVVDGISWRIIIEDFITGYTDFMRGGSGRSADEGILFSDWSCKLAEAANTPVIEKEAAYWRQVIRSGHDHLKTDACVSERLTMDFRNKKLIVPERETALLLRDVNRTYRTNTQDILLSCLALSLFHWQNMTRLFIHLEGHGRQALSAGARAARTVGWFTSLFPVLIELPEHPVIADLIKTVKETLRRVPGHGNGYGMLKYLSRDRLARLLSGDEEPMICFNYLGELDSSMENNPMGLSIVSFEHTTGLMSEKTYAIEINCFVRNGRLEVWFGTHCREFSESNIHRFIELFNENLDKIIRICTEKSQPEWTPSDFGDSSLSLSDLDTISGFIDCIE
ncbi:amino acid adenylation domain-containing protein [bacterium]|nr:amino acid adenylation domain-containing protein [bacterium]